MTQDPTKFVPRILAVTKDALAASSLPEFLAGLRTGYESIYRTLMCEPGGLAGLDALDMAFSAARRYPKQRQVLELCAWPVLDKPALPEDARRIPEFLWLFAIPVLVQLPQSQDELLILPGDLIDAGALADTLEHSGCINPKAIIAGLSSLYSKDDLHAHGPRAIAGLFVDAELGTLGALPAPLPIIRDPEIESGRVAALYALLAARLPVGEVQLIVDENKWPSVAIQAQLSSALTQAEIDFEELSCEVGHSLSAAMYRCTGQGYKELERWLELGIQHYGVTSAYLTLPVEGMAELVGVTDKGEELLLAPSFSFVEPAAVLQDCCQQICDCRQIRFTGMFVSAAPSSAALH